MTNAETYSQNSARYAEARRELGKVNKAAIFDALTALSITEVLVEFDGEGDSGQIEMLTFVRNGEPVPVPEATVTLQQASFVSTESANSEFTLREGIGDALLRLSSKTSMAAGKTTTARSANSTSTSQNARWELSEFHGRFTDVSTSHHSF